MSITVPARVGDGTTFRLEGQGMPYYAGGPAGLLVLTIAISAQASPLALPRDSLERTVAVSLPNAGLPSVEEPSAPPASTEAPGDHEPTVPASNESKSAPTAFGSNAPSLPKEPATPARQTSFTAEMAPSSTTSAMRAEKLTPAEPVKRNILRFILLGLVGLVIVALGGGITWLTLSHPSPTVVTPTAPTGVITEFPIPTAKSNPNGIAAGPDGNLWFPEDNGNQIGRISPNGSITEFPIPTDSSSPSGITAGPDGNLWFTEQVGNQIGRISPNGTITEFLIPPASSGSGWIVAGPDGALWFTEGNSNQIGRITSGK